MNRGFIGALSMSVATALLSACTGSQPPSSALSAMPYSRVIPEKLMHAGSWMLSKATGDELVYIAESAGVGVYSTAGKNVGLLKGLNNPGICSDSQGNVWVTYGDSLLEYEHGGTIPIAQTYLAPGFRAISCAFDPTSGRFAVSESSNSTQNIAVYQAIYGTPQVYTDPDFFTYAYVTYDDEGDLFVNGTHHDNNVFAELVAGSDTLATLSLDQKIRRIGGLQWDGQYLALGDSLNHVVYQTSVSNGHATTQGTTHFHGWRPKFKAVVPFAIEDGLIVLAFASGKVGYFNYPQGGRATNQIPVYTNDNVTISIPPSRAMRRQP